MAAEVISMQVLLGPEVMSTSCADVTIGTLRFIGRQRDGNGKKTLYDMCL